MNEWDKRFAGDFFAYGKVANDFLMEAADHLKPQSRILSLAEGEGRNANFLAAAGHQVTALDSSNVGLEKAAGLAAENGHHITTLLVDLSDYHIEPDRWDAVVSIFCHLPQPLRQRIHREVVQGITPGGVLILEAYTPRQLIHKTGGPPMLELLMELDELLVEFEGLEWIQAKEVEREIQEGHLHNGTSAVVQLIGRRPE